MSSDGPVSEYARLARRAAEDAARRAAAPVRAVRQQKQDLEWARADLAAARAELRTARVEIDRLTGALDAAGREADPRRATEAVEQVIDQQASDLSAIDRGDHTAPELRDLALAVADLDVNRTPGMVVVPDDDPALRAVIAAATSGERVVVSVAADGFDVEELVAMAYLSSPSQRSTRDSLERLAPLLVSGGRLVLAAYESSPGCRQAVDVYFRDRHMDFRFERHNRLHVVRR